jgi:type II secretory pathway pseudopilin PulG
MIEIAISLAIIGFALVAIIGVLPIGMNVQKDNREETIINQDATVMMDAIRNGAQGLDDLTNYVIAITNTVFSYQRPAMKSTFIGTYGYTRTNSSGMSYQFPLTNGFRIVGLLSTPKYVSWVSAKPAGSGYYSNNVVAYVRSMSGAAYEKYPQSNPDVQDLGFSYRMTSEVVPYGTNYYDPSWTAVDTNYANVVNNLNANLHDVRLTFRWPLRSRGQLGQGGQAFRTLAGGFLQETNEPGYYRSASAPLVPTPYDLYFFQSRTYVKQ